MGEEVDEETGLLYLLRDHLVMLTLQPRHRAERRCSAVCAQPYAHADWHLWEGSWRGGMRLEQSGASFLRERRELLLPGRREGGEELGEG